MTLDANQLSSPQSYHADICILGGGVAGIVIANELAKHFNKVLLLDGGDTTYSQSSQDCYAPNKVSKHFPDPTYTRLRFLGGTSNHWLNSTAPLDPIDFEERSWVANSGWPIQFEDIAPYYDKAGHYCGVQDGDFSHETWLSYLNKEGILEQSDSLRFGIAKIASPPTRFFDKYKETLANYKSLQTIKNANVVDIQANEGTVKSITFKSFANDLEHEVKAQKFVMCFGGIENARMLLHFNQKNGNTLGNQHDTVGRYFMDHPTMIPAQIFTSDTAVASNNKNNGEFNINTYLSLTDKALRKNETTNLRMPAFQASNYQISDGISSYHIIKQGIEKGEMAEDFLSHVGRFFGDFDMVLEAFYRQKFSEELFEHANEMGGYELNVMMEQEPVRENRVYLSDKKDKFGIPKINIDWQLTENDKARLWKSLEATGKELGALSMGRLRMLVERSDRLFGDQMGFGNHHMGTTRMAHSSKEGVVDKDLKVFGCTNLYIAGSSVFSTGGHVPPTLTIVALSIKLAEHLIQGHKHVG